MSFNKWIDKETVVHTDNGMLFSVKKKKDISTHEKDKETPWMHSVKWKKPI